MPWEVVLVKPMNIKWLECKKKQKTGTRRVSERDVVRGGKKLPTVTNAWIVSYNFNSFFFCFVKHANEANDTRHTSNRIRNKYCKWTHFNVDLSCCRCGKHFILFDSRVIYVLSSLVSELVFSFCGTFYPLFYSLPFSVLGSREPVFSFFFVPQCFRVCLHAITCPRNSLWPHSTQ